MLIGVPVYASIVSRESVRIICQQNTVEAATFGSEIIAARLAKEKVQALFYKLRMMGIKMDGPLIAICFSAFFLKIFPKFDYIIAMAVIAHHC